MSSKHVPLQRILTALFVTLSLALTACDETRPPRKPASLREILDSADTTRKIFHPHPSPRNERENAVNYDIPVENARLGARFYLFDPRLPTLLFFHGNGEVLDDFDDVADDFRKAGANLFLVEYRGYGWSTGTPSLSSLYDDTDRAADFFLNELRQKAPLSAPVLMGRSLGSGPASYLVIRHPDRFRGLVLESGFSDIRPLLRLLEIRTGAFEEEAHKLLSNSPRMKLIKIPVLILHGEFDTTIPLAQARENFAAITHKNKRLQIVAGVGHNDILTNREEYFGALRSFLLRTR